MDATNPDYYYHRRLTMTLRRFCIKNGHACGDGKYETYEVGETHLANKMTIVLGFPNDDVERLKRYYDALQRLGHEIPFPEKIYSQADPTLYH